MTGQRADTGGRTCDLAHGTPREAEVEVVRGERALGVAREAHDGVGEDEADEREHTDPAVLDLGLAQPLHVVQSGEAQRIKPILLADVALELGGSVEHGRDLGLGHHVGRGRPRRHVRLQRAGELQRRERHECAGHHCC